MPLSDQVSAWSQLYKQIIWAGKSWRLNLKWRIRKELQVPLKKKTTCYFLWEESDTVLVGFLITNLEPVGLSLNNIFGNEDILREKEQESRWGQNTLYLALMWGVRKWKGFFFFGPFGLVLQGQNLSQTRIKKGEGSLWICWGKDRLLCLYSRVEAHLPLTGSLRSCLWSLVLSAQTSAPFSAAPGFGWACWLFFNFNWEMSLKSYSVWVHHAQYLYQLLQCFEHYSWQ